MGRACIQDWKSIHLLNVCVCVANVWQSPLFSTRNHMDGHWSFRSCRTIFVVIENHRNVVREGFGTQWRDEKTRMYDAKVAQLTFMERSGSTALTHTHRTGVDVSLIHLRLFAFNGPMCKLLLFGLVKEPCGGRWASVSLNTEMARTDQAFWEGRLCD